MIFDNKFNFQRGFDSIANQLGSEIKLITEIPVMGGLPISLEQRLILNSKQGIDIYDDSLKLLKSIESKVLLSGGFGNIVYGNIVRDGVYFFDIIRGEFVRKSETTSLLKGTPFQDQMVISEKGRFFRWIMSNDTVAWINEEDERILAFVTDGRYLIGRNQRGNKLFCYDYESGQKYWEISMVELDLNTTGDFFGASYILNDLCISTNEHRNYFGLDLKTGELVWQKKLPPESLGQVVTTDFRHHSICFSGSSANVLTYLVMNCLDGELEVCTSIEEYVGPRKPFPEHGAIKRRPFGRFTGSVDRIYISVLNRLVEFNRRSGAFRLVHEHSSSLIFSRIIKDKLYITDDSGKLLVFE